MEMSTVVKEEYVAWRRDPITKEFLEMVKQERENAKEMIAQGRWKDTELNQVIGFCVGLLAVINVEFKEETDAESDSVEGNSQA